MQKEFKPSGAKATNSFKKRFNYSLLRITSLYTLTLIVILFVSGTVTYSEFSSRIGRRFGGFPTMPPQMRVFLKDQPTAAQVREDLVQSIIFVNIFLLMLASISSYWLARRTLQPIKDAYERQQRFLSDASHELRTPLSILHIELENELYGLTKGPEFEKLSSKLEEVKRMSALVNNLLVLSRLDEGKIDVKKVADVHIEQVISEIVKRLQPLAHSNSLTLAYKAESKNPLISLNEDLFSHALTNLILNAIVYNKPDGKVDVISKIEGNQIVIEVIDTGIGISAHDLQNIFERFYRSDKSRTRKTGGSGLGLSIARSAIHHLHGRLEIESKIDVGTAVIIHLPLKQ
jgi:two-component system sensor histidine kinase CiaH